jgi:hypothetical protein
VSSPSCMHWRSVLQVSKSSVSPKLLVNISGVQSLQLRLLEPVLPVPKTSWSIVTWPKLYALLAVCDLAHSM